MVLLLGEDDVARTLDTQTAYDAAEQAFRLLGEDAATNGVRQRVERGGATLNVMAAVAPTLGAMGVKTYPVVRTDVSQGSDFTFQLFDLPAGTLRAIVRADVLGQRRTAAASAVATRALARAGSTTLTVFGAGWQARGQVTAIVAALPSLSAVQVVGRSAGRAAEFCEALEAELGIPVRTAAPEAAVRGADVVVTATGSATPVFDGSWLRPGTHVCAVGSNYPDKQELDATAVRRADLVVVDALDVARAECGDLLAAGVEWPAVRSLGDVVVGRCGRTGDQQITVFESQGLALLDLVAAVRVVERTEAADLRPT